MKAQIRSSKERFHVIYHIFCVNNVYFENQKIINDILVILTSIFDGGFYEDPAILPKARLNIMLMNMLMNIYDK